LQFWWRAYDWCAASPTGQEMGFSMKEIKLLIDGKIREESEVEK